MSSWGGTRRDLDSGHRLSRHHVGNPERRPRYLRNGRYLSLTVMVSIIPLYRCPGIRHANTKRDASAPLKRRNAHELSDHKQGRPTEEPSDVSWEIDPSTARRNRDGT